MRLIEELGDPEEAARLRRLAEGCRERLEVLGDLDTPEATIQRRVLRSALSRLTVEAEFLESHEAPPPPDPSGPTFRMVRSEDGSIDFVECEPTQVLTEGEEAEWVDRLIAEDPMLQFDVDIPKGASPKIALLALVQHLDESIRPLGIEDS